jgi:hypothetical protein
LARKRLPPPIKRSLAIKPQKILPSVRANKGNPRNRSDSCTVLAVFRNKFGVLKNTLKRIRKEYTAVRNAVTIPSQKINFVFIPNEPTAVSKIMSLEKKPVKKGNPVIAKLAIKKLVYDRGKIFKRPPIRRISCSLFSECITAPAQRKSNALNTA